MSALTSLNISYLLFVPYREKLERSPNTLTTAPKGAPYFYEHDIEMTPPQEGQFTVQNLPIKMTNQTYDNFVRLIDCRYTIQITEGESSIKKNFEIQEELKKRFFEEMHVLPTDVHEAYTIILCELPSGNPDQFIEENSRILAHCIRDSFEKPLDTLEVESILSTRVRYSMHDATVVDWNGAVVVSDDPDFQSEIDLFKIGNYQLMRYRMLDSQLEERLASLQEIVDKPKRSFFPKQERLLQDMMSQRLSLLLNFEKLDQSILLIGDWYTSKLYKAIVTEFYIDGWKTIVQNKLESLRSIHEVVTQNLTVSWARILDLTSMIGWFVMMVGYFILMFYDFARR